MKFIFTITLLFSLTSMAHQHCGFLCPDKIAQAIGVAPAIVNIAWNGGELLNHALAVHDECHVNEFELLNPTTWGWVWHGLELGLHGANLLWGVSSLCGVEPQSRLAAIILTLANSAGAFAQVNTFFLRGLSWKAITLAPFAIVDLLGHLSSTWTSSALLRIHLKQS